MVKPISYLQSDNRWANHNYSAKGETKTIKAAGCGPTAAAMVIATLKDKNVTPVTTAEWSMANGYKALNQGTFYTYFVPQFNKYGIECRRINTSNLYGVTSSASHTEALEALKKGDWVIACMGVGNWTTSGHFILVYGYENGYVYINDPASTSSTRIKNTWSLFSKQVKYLWTVKVPDSFKTSGNSNTFGNNVYETFVRGVQSTCGANVDGKAGSETLSKTITVSKTINRQHPVVNVLQTYLNTLGYNCGNVDGTAGDKFDAAVKKYQKDNSCVIDGEITAGKATWKKLLKLA